MARGRLRLEWDQTSLLWYTLAEPNRNQDEWPEPFKPEDVHPLYKKTKPAEASGEPDMALWARITSHSPVTKIDISKLQ